MDRNALRRSERLYALFLQLYPVGYRQEFGEEMKYVFSQSLQDATVEAGGSTPLSFWLGSIGDTAISVIRQHLENIQERMSMKPTTARSDMPKMHIRRLVIGTAAVLSIPLIMMQMSSDWNWNLFDFF